jgi:hypothetical protein
MQVATTPLERAKAIYDLISGEARESELASAKADGSAGVVKVTGFTDALDDTPARKRRPTRQVRATPPMQSSVSACKPAG